MKRIVNSLRAVQTAWFTIRASKISYNLIRLDQIVLEMGFELHTMHNCCSEPVWSQAEFLTQAGAGWLRFVLGRLGRGLRIRMRTGSSNLKVPSQVPGLVH